MEKRKRFTTTLDPDLLKKVKHYAISNNLEICEFLEKALRVDAQLIIPMQDKEKISLHLDGDLLAELKHDAVKKSRTVNTIIEYRLINYFKGCEKEKGTKK